MCVFFFYFKDGSRSRRSCRGRCSRDRRESSIQKDCPPPLFFSDIDLSNQNATTGGSIKYSSGATGQVRKTGPDLDLAISQVQKDGPDLDLAIWQVQKDGPDLDFAFAQVQKNGPDLNLALGLRNRIGSGPDLGLIRS